MSLGWVTAFFTVLLGVAAKCPEPGMFTVCAMVLGVYGTFATLLFSSSGVRSPFTVLNGETNGFDRVLFASLSRRRFTDSGDDILSML